MSSTIIFNRESPNASMSINFFTLEIVNMNELLGNHLYQLYLKANTHTDMMKLEMSKNKFKR